MPPKKKTKKSLGRRFVEWKPLTSRYPDDEKKARLQEDRVADMIDFFVPQTKKDVALEAAFALVPGSKLLKGTGSAIKRKTPEVIEYIKSYISDPKYLEDLSGIMGSLDDAVELKGRYLDRLKWVSRSIKEVPNKEIEKLRPKHMRDTGGEIHALFDPHSDNIYVNTNTAAKIDEKSAVPLLAEEIMHYVTKGNSDLHNAIQAVIKQNQTAVPRLGRLVKSYAADHTPRITKKTVQYAQDPTETYSKIMATRATGGLKPGEVIGEVDLPNVPIFGEPRTAFDRSQKIANETLQDLRHGYTDKEIANLMTKLPLVTPNIDPSKLEEVELP